MYSKKPGIKEVLISKKGRFIVQVETSYSGDGGNMRKRKHHLRNIRFQSPFPARLRVFFQDGTVIYNSAEEATADMVERGIPVTVLKNPTSLLDQINRLTWRPSRKQDNRESSRLKPNFKERLHAFRCQDA